MTDYINDYTALLNRPEYHAPTLVPLSAKGGKYYVCVTMPEALRRGAKRQMMRSTGTTDIRVAKTKIVPKANEIYAEFDKAFRKLHQQHITQTNTPGLTNTIGDFNGVFTEDPFLIRKFGLDKNPELKVSRLLPDWLEHLEHTNQGDPKERKSRASKVGEFVSVVGDLNVEDIAKQHAYQYAKWLHSEGKANKTIRSLITKVTAFLTWSEQEGHIKSNPFVNLKLSHYGAESLPFLPFEPEELTAIFEQDIAPQERLLLSLLAVTGARLDEIALLNWSQVQCLHGITYLDLRADQIRVKTDGSHRVIPVHSVVAPMLMGGGTGRVFDYRIDENGKAQGAASKAVMPYIRQITKERRKVAHSLRGTFKQMLENAGVTPEMVERLEAGEISLVEIDQALSDNRVEKRVNDKITGHSAKDVAGKYGFGPLLIPRAVAIEKLDVSFLQLSAE
jgi:site-specific recombinase XerD